ncbi:MAG: ABC transporter permease [Deltaproteobacteria bacterium]|nr:ABC transporter permease [Deltaproteobacteria bacterium]
MSWLRIRELVRKEFIQLFREKKNLPLLLVAPFIQMIVFGYVVTTDVRDIRVAVLDQAMTRESRMLMDVLNANNTFRITHIVFHPRDLDELLLERQVDITVQIPPDFSERIRQGDSAPLQILADGSMSNISSSRVAYTSTVLNRFNRSLIQEIYQRKMEYGEIDARIRTWYNPNLDSQNFFIPGIVAFLIMLISLLFTSLAIIREKEAGTIEQLIVTPVKPSELIIGKTIPYIIIAIGQMFMVITFAVFWFAVPLKGSLLLLFMAVCLFLLSSLGIGLFISTLSDTQQQAMMTTFFFIMPFFMLSGLIFPIANMPQMIQWFTYLNPLRYFLVIIRGIFIKGVGLEVLWPQFAALTIIGILVFAGAVHFFRKRLD